jgi:hypothetical protein
VNGTTNAGTRGIHDSVAVVAWAVGLGAVAGILGPGDGEPKKPTPATKCRLGTNFGTGAVSRCRGLCGSAP